MPVAELVRGSEYVDGHPSMDAPKLTVRVLGPTPMDTLATAPAARFETRVRVQNDGDEVAVVEQARVEFDVWSDAGVQSRCIADEASDMDETIAPGEFAEMTAVAQCALPSPGEYEVRTYVAFEADARDGSTDIERYYAGRRDIVVR